MHVLILGVMQRYHKVLKYESDLSVNNNNNDDEYVERVSFFLYTLRTI